MWKKIFCAIWVYGSGGGGEASIIHTRRENGSHLPYACYVGNCMSNIASNVIVNVLTGREIQEIVTIFFGVMLCPNIECTGTRSTEMSVKCRTHGQCIIYHIKLKLISKPGTRLLEPSHPVTKCTFWAI